MHEFSQINVKDSFHVDNLVCLIITHLFTSFLFTDNGHTLRKALVHYLEDYTSMRTFNWAVANRNVTFSNWEKCRDIVIEREVGGRPAHVHMFGCLVALFVRYGTFLHYYSIIFGQLLLLHYCSFFQIFNALLQSMVLAYF